MTMRESEDRQRWQVFDGNAMTLSHDLYITRGSRGKYWILILKHAPNSSAETASGKHGIPTSENCLKVHQKHVQAKWLRFGWLDWYNLRWHPINPWVFPSVGRNSGEIPIDHRGGGNVLSDGHPFVATLLKRWPFCSCEWAAKVYGFCISNE